MMGSSIALATILFVLGIQDFRNREVHLLSLIFLIPLQFYYFTEKQLSFSLKQCVQNALILAVYVLTLVVYLMVKEKRVLNPFKKHMGFGDFLFLAFVLPFFTSTGFVLFLNCSFLLALIIETPIQRRKKNNTIPLISYLCVVYLFFMFSEHLTGSCFFSLLQPVTNY